MNNFLPQLMSHFEIGQEIDNYTILSEIDRGGMGIVFKVVEKNSQRVFAMKIISVQNNISKKRFLREVKLAASLDHENIVKIYTAGQSNGQMYLIMEYLEGVTLKKWTNKQAISSEDAIKITIQIVKALNYAHKKNIIHRDIKPSNIMVSPNGTIKLMDFGLAKGLHIGEFSLTKTGAMIGTPRYMAPEQIENAKSRKLNYQIDIYAVGAIFYELISGQEMIPGKTTLEIILNLKEQNFVDLSEYAPEISKNIKTIWKKSVAFRKQRYVNMSLFLQDLYLIAENKKITTKSPFNLNITYVTTMLFVTIITLLIGYRFLILQLDPVKKTEYTNTYLDGVIAFEGRQYEEAYHIFKETKEKNSLLSFYLGASLYERSKNLDDIENAIKKLKNALEKIPTHLETNYYLAKAHRNLGNIEKTQNYLQQCINISPNSTLYYIELAEIYFKLAKEKDIDASFLCFENLKRVFSIEQGNLQASNLLFELAAYCPHFQEVSWDILNNMFFAPKKAKPPHLFGEYFQKIRVNTQRGYIQGLAGKKNKHFYIHLAAIAYLKQRSVNFAKVEKGTKFYKQILLDQNTLVYNRFLAAKSLADTRQFELLNDFSTKVDIVGQVIINVILRLFQMPKKITRSMKNFNFLDSLSLNEQIFMKILIAESYYIFHPKYKEKISNKNADEIFKILMASKNKKIQLATAACIFNIYPLKNQLAKMANNSLRNFLKNENEKLRRYAYFYFLNSFNVKNNKKFFIDIYQNGLLDKKEDINLLICSFFNKTDKIINNLRVPFSKLLKKNNKELLLRASCLWILSAPKIKEILMFLESNKYSSFNKVFLIKYFMLSTVIDGVDKKFFDVKLTPEIFLKIFPIIQKMRINTKKRFPDYQKIQSFIIKKRNDISFQTNMYFLMYNWNIHNNISEQGLVGILNKKRVLQNNYTTATEQRNLSNNKYFYDTNSKSDAIRQISYTYLMFLLGNKIFTHCEKLRFEKNKFSRLGASEGLRNLTRLKKEKMSQITRLTSRGKNFFKPYNRYLVEEKGQKYEQKITQEKNQKTLRTLYYAVELYSSIEALYEYALALKVSKNMKKAIENLNLLIEKNPNSYKAKIMLAEIEDETGSQRKIDITNMYRKIKNPFHLEKLANIYLGRKLHKKAISVYKKLFVIDPYKKKYLLQIILSYCLENDKKNALFYANWGIEMYKNTNNLINIMKKQDFIDPRYQLIKNEQIIYSLSD